MLTPAPRARCTLRRPPEPDMDPRQAQFTQLLLAVQPRLKVYIRAMVGDAVAADDILQQTNLVLIKKSEQFTLGSDFAAWALKIAHYEVLKQRQTFARSRLIFDEALAEEMAHAAAEETLDLPEQKAALASCLGRLSAAHRGLIQRRYSTASSIDDLAAALGRPAGSVRQTLFRIRQTLADCIRARMSGGEA
ncbi:MAG: sigma-70 family RNA polymerase sigma factor [Planctomycetes bacterium]|nr:sigma-70 family RNA polymerase sigma factor [Planctomycetota bacterium]